MAQTETLPEGWTQDPETGIKSYNPVELMKRMVSGKSDLQKDRIVRGERVIDDVSGLVARVEALEAKMKNMVGIVSTLSERLDETP